MGCGLYFVLLPSLPFSLQESHRFAFAMWWGWRQRAWTGGDCWHYRSKRLVACFWSIFGKKVIRRKLSAWVVLAVHAEKVQRGPQAGTLFGRTIESCLLVLQGLMIHALPRWGFSRVVSSLTTLRVLEKWEVWTGISSRWRRTVIEFYTSAVSAPAIRLLYVAALPCSLLVQLDA